jgi:hypothetical protein
MIPPIPAATAAKAGHHRAHHPLIAAHPGHHDKLGKVTSTTSSTNTTAANSSITGPKRRPLRNFTVPMFRRRV